MDQWITDAIPVVGGLLSGLFAKKPSYNPAQQMQMKLAQQLQDYANSIPGSTAAEQASLGQANALLGQQQADQRQQVYAQLPANATASNADLVQNLTNSQIGQKMSLDMSQLINSLNSRQQALMQAAGVAGGVGPQQQYPNDIGESLANLAYMYAQKKAMGNAPGSKPVTAQSAGSEGVLPGMQLTMPPMGGQTTPGVNAPWSPGINIPQLSVPAMPGSMAAQSVATPASAAGYAPGMAGSLMNALPTNARAQYPSGINTQAWTGLGGMGQGLLSGLGLRRGR